MQESIPALKKNLHPRPVTVIVKAKPQAKKAKTDPPSAQEPFLKTTKSLETNAQDSQRKDKTPNGNTNSSTVAIKGGLSGLVSYSDESDED